MEASGYAHARTVQPSCPVIVCSPPPKPSQVLAHLQAGLLSDIAHARAVFRDLDLGHTGVIAFPEFRALLRRHTLDVGMSDADVLQLMGRFPPARDATGACTSPPPPRAAVHCVRSLPLKPRAAIKCLLAFGVAGLLACSLLI